MSDNVIQSEFQTGVFTYLQHLTEQNNVPELVNSVKWLHQHHCWCPTFVIGDMFALLYNELETKPSQTLFHLDDQYVTCIDTIVERLKKLHSKGIKPALQKIWEFITQEEKFYRQRRHLHFFQQLVRAYFPLVKQAEGDSEQSNLKEIIAAMKTFCKALEISTIVELLHDSAFLLALSGFVRDHLHADIDLETLLRVAEKGQKRLHQISPVFTPLIEQKKSPYDAHYGEVEIEMTIDLDKAEKFLPIEWLRGDPFYLSGPNVSSGNNSRPYYEQKIHTDFVLCVDPRHATEEPPAHLNRYLYFFENKFLDQETRKKYLALRYIHQYYEYLFCLKLFSYGVEAYRYYEYQTPPPPTLEVRIKIDTTQNWNDGTDFVEGQKNIGQRLEFGLELARKLVHDIDYPINVFYQVFDGSESDRYTRAYPVNNFEELLLREVFSFAYTGFTFKRILPRPDLNRFYDKSLRGKRRSAKRHQTQESKAPRNRMIIDIRIVSEQTYQTDDPNSADVHLYYYIWNKHEEYELSRCEQPQGNKMPLGEPCTSLDEGVRYIIASIAQEFNQHLFEAEGESSEELEDYFSERGIERWQ